MDSEKHKKDLDSPSLNQTEIKELPKHYERTITNQ